MAEPYCDVQNGSTVIHVDGAAVIDCAARIHQIFIEAVDSHLPVVLDLEHLTECDSSFIQLVRSLCYTLNRGGRAALQLSQNSSIELLCELKKSTGLQFHAGCTRVEHAECFCCKTELIRDQKVGRN